MRRESVPSRRAMRFYMSEWTGDRALECLGVWSTAVRSEEAVCTMPQG
jgi:hypothetical protein